MQSFREFVELDEGPFATLGPKALALANHPTVQTMAAGGVAQGLSPQGQAAISDPTKQSAISQNLDVLQAGLDAAGLEPSIGTFADIANAGISSTRAMFDKSNRKEHVRNALISLVSMIPFGDIAKLLKTGKYGRMAAKATITAARPIKTGAAMAKHQRMSQAMPSLA